MVSIREPALPEFAGLRAGADYQVERHDEHDNAADTYALGGPVGESCRNLTAAEGEGWDLLPAPSLPSREVPLSPDSAPGRIAEEDIKAALTCKQVLRREEITIPPRLSEC